MSTARAFWSAPAMTIALIAVLGAAPQAIATELGATVKAALGQPAPVGYESVVLPDGSGLPPGRGSVAEGKRLYAQHCGACHGPDGKQQGNELAGGVGTLTGARPLKTVGSYWPYATTLFDYVARAMPYGNEKSLSASETYAVVAYVLYLNDILSASAVLNREQLPLIRMPNRDGFEHDSSFLPVGVGGVLPD